MVTPIRTIAMLVALAVLLAGPVSSLAALIDSDCCCTETATQVDQTPADSCCKAEQTPVEHQPCQDDDGHCPGDCDCCVSCSAIGPTVQLNRPSANLHLPDRQPDAFTSAEPQSHAIEANFSLLRPPQR